MTSKWLFSGALAFELGSWSALIGDPTLVEALYLYILPHAAGSALLAAGLWLLLPRRYKFPLPWSPLLLFSFIFFIFTFFKHDYNIYQPFLCKSSHSYFSLPLS